MAFKVLIASTTAAVATSSATNQINLEDGESCLIVASGLAGAETCAVKHILADGTELAALDTDLSTLLLTATDYQKRILGPCNIRVSKDATAGSAGVTLYY